MRERLRSHLTYANVLVTLLAFVVLGGGAYAATGGNLILGQSNSATSKTSLSAQISDKALEVTNTSTGVGATALGLNVASGHAPFTVNSDTRVANLNADKLDGIDSSGLVRGRGTLLSNRIVFSPGATKTLLVIPGLGELQAYCSFHASVIWTNTTSSNIDAWWEDETGSWYAQVIPPNTSVNVADSEPTRVGTLGLGQGNDPGPRTVATLHAFAYKSGAGAPCGFQVQGTRWTSG